MDTEQKTQGLKQTWSSHVRGHTVCPQLGFIRPPMEESKEHIQLLRQAVEAKFCHRLLTPKDFDLLAETQAERLGERVSTSTLKRIWGYVSTTSMPRRNTLDVLAQFVGASPPGPATVPGASPPGPATVPGASPPGPAATAANAQPHAGGGEVPAQKPAPPTQPERYCHGTC